MDIVSVGENSSHESLPKLHEQAEEPTTDFKRALMFGLALKLGGCSIAWNYGFASGFWEYLIAVLVVGIGYLMLGLCMAEMVSILTFDGGYYGYARVTIGPLGGYLVGCSGLIESIFYFGAYPLKIAQFIDICFDLDSKYNPIVWVLVYVALVAVHSCLGRQFWNAISLFTLCSLVLFAIFLFGSMPSLDFEKFAMRSAGFNRDPDVFFDVFRLSVLFFLGFDLLTLTSSEVKESKKAVPRAMLLLIGAMIVLAVWLMFTVASQAPGVTPELFQKSTLFPFVFGYMHILGISYKAATAISIVPSIGTALAYFFIIAKQVTAMASSGLLPPVLKTRFGPNDTPLYAYLLVSGCALAANFFARFVNIYSTSTRTATIAGCFVYLSMFYCYYVFTHRYGHMDRAFRNPLGWVSAVIGSVIFLGILVILLAFHLEYRVVTIFYFAYIALMVLFYYVYVESHQHFSSSEQKVFFKAYIINLQKRKRKTFIQRLLHDVRKVFRGVSKRLPLSLPLPLAGRAYSQINPEKSTTAHLSNSSSGVIVRGTSSVMEKKVVEEISSSDRSLESSSLHLCSVQSNADSLEEGRGSLAPRLSPLPEEKLGRSLSLLEEFRGSPVSSRKKSEADGLDQGLGQGEGLWKKRRSSHEVAATATMDSHQDELLLETHDV